MSRIDLHFPVTVLAYGALYDRANKYNLDQDMLEILLPDDIVIDVGWYPDWDLDGQYRVTVFRGDTDHPLEDDFTTQDVDAVKFHLYALVSRYCQFAVPFTDSQDTSESLFLNGQLRPSTEHIPRETITESSKVTV